MTIPIPEYLVTIAEIEEQKKEKLTMGIKCTCGCKRFFILKNSKISTLTKEDKKKMNNSLTWYEKNLYPMIINTSCKFVRTSDETYHEIIVYDSSKLAGSAFDISKDSSQIVKSYKFKHGEVPLSFDEIRKLDPYDDTVIIKAVCVDCGNEYILFDSRIHGNDAADFIEDMTTKYAFKRKHIKNSEDDASEICITIKNYWDFDDIESNGNEGLTFSDYSNMFGYIKIQAKNNDTKQLIYSAELG